MAINKKTISDSWVMAGVRDIKKSVAFYAKLGLKPAMESAFYAELNLPGGTVLGLHTIERAKKAKKSSDGGWGIMLRVKNLPKVVSDLKEQQVRCGKIAHAPGGADFSSVLDPDGNRLVLLEMGK